MDITSVYVPLLSPEKNERISYENRNMCETLEKKAKSTKILITEEVSEKDSKKKHTYTQYQLRLKPGMSYVGIRNVHNFIDQMMVSTRISCNSILQEGKTENDLKRLFTEMLYSDTVCFNKLKDVYNESIGNMDFIEEPVRMFLELFDIKEERKYTISDLEHGIDKIVSDSDKNVEDKVAICESLKSSVRSARYNAIILGNINKKRVHYEKEKEKSRKVVTKAKK